MRNESKSPLIRSGMYLDVMKSKPTFDFAKRRRKGPHTASVNPFPPGVYHVNGLRLHLHNNAMLLLPTVVLGDEAERAD